MNNLAWKVFTPALLLYSHNYQAGSPMPSAMFFENTLEQKLYSQTFHLWLHTNFTELETLGYS